MNRPKFYIYLPIFFALILILGIFIGSTFKLGGNFGSIHVDAGNKYNKLEEILKYIDQEYVDTVNNKKLIESTITSMLQTLDPHSSYISAEELAANNEPLQGNFEGIGVEFNIVGDTIRVIDAIQGGPAEAVGIMAGDRIVKVEGVSVAGIKITNKMVMEKLKGVGGTKVKVSVLRTGKKNLIDFTITRGTIPIYSVDAAYMVAPKTGYIKIARFAATTYNEYIEAFHKLQGKGLENLIIDLRGNGGGYLNTATAIADEFLDEGKGILYTEGKARPRKDYKASSKGEFEKGKLIVLIDDGSASASEILAGALQDNDRATIVGRRSFGKGLVQEQSEFSDGSAIRLTIARYYTPSGRCIQKPYNGDIVAYYSEEYDRMKSGELENADSIKVADSLKYKTLSGRIVYGGGGITPDVFVPLDTIGRTHYLSEVLYNGLVNDFAFEYADKQRIKLRSFKTVENFIRSFNVTPEILNDFVTYAEKKGVKRKDEQIKRSENLIRTQLKALIARNIWSNEGFYPVYQEQDPVLKKALGILQ
jgi:carboxyl-terminal processing protease